MVDYRSYNLTKTKRRNKENKIMNILNPTRFFSYGNKLKPSGHNDCSETLAGIYK